MDELIRELASHPEAMHQLSPEQFEQLVAELLRGFGFDVSLTARTADGGVDIIAVSGDPATRTLVQCKRYKPENKVGVEQLRSLYGTLMSEKANKAILVTTSTFTNDAKAFADQQKTMLETVDAATLQDWISRYIAAQEETADNPISLYFDTSEFSHEEIQEILGQLASLYEECGGDRLTVEHVDVLDPSLLFVPA